MARSRTRSRERPWYEAGRGLSAEDLAAEQLYRRQHLRRHLRFAHGWGVVCGLQVVPAPAARRPWRVRVCPGYAIDPCGNEIIVPAPVLLDLALAAGQAPNTAATVAVPLVAYVAIRFAETALRPAAVPPAGCTCECDERTTPTRMRDGYHLDVLWQPPLVRGTTFDLCDARAVPCPPAVGVPYVVLARVTLPADAGTSVATDGILYP